jgi:pSer/pThr/pTyr-binding forkhead associated (FHA) protein
VVKLTVLSGKKAGLVYVARRFPVRIGRSAKAELQLDDDGMWEQHLQIGLKPAEGFILTAQGTALATINGERQRETVLHNGDLIEIGPLRIQFTVAETRQAGLAVREWFLWSLISLVTAFQVALVYLLLR